jgi:phytoene/squalene synthetase
MNKLSPSSQILAEAITKASSKQTYYTIRLLVDRKLVGDAYRAYGYFRWVDDVLDADAGSRSEKISFAQRQKTLLESFYEGGVQDDLCPEEKILADLVRNDTAVNNGLRSYLTNMMAVMVFDAGRRGNTVAQSELNEYTFNLATAVTDAMHYFIGHDDVSPECDYRYLAVNAAHITHMMRDAREDIQAGYFNVPSEYLQERGLAPRDFDSLAYRAWVCRRVKLARQHFKAGREYLAQVKNLRCRLAGYAYSARFEWMLRTIERDNYCLRSEYPERKSLRAGFWMVWNTLVSFFSFPQVKPDSPESRELTA